MKAMILAAGRGERLRPLTDVTPKPLLIYQGKPLIEYSLERLRQAGFNDIVINVAHLGQQIIEYCGDGKRWGVNIVYSNEGTQALETAGGIAKALPLLGDAAFVVVNADVVCDYDLSALRQKTVDWAHLVMVANPQHHQQGDFGVDDQGRLSCVVESKSTYSGIGVYHPRLFAGVPAQPLKLRPVLDEAIQAGHLTGELFGGRWDDIGTVERLLSAA